MNNPFESAMEQLKKAGILIKGSTKQNSEEIETLLKKLQNPEKIIQVWIPVQMDNGETKFFEGTRVQFSSERGPYKGGIRFHLEVSLEEVKALSFWMAIKCAVAGIPMGGGKGGVIVDPYKLSEKELEKLSRGYVKAIADNIGAYIDVPAPDVNTNPKIMKWMTQEYSEEMKKKNRKISEMQIKATFTGKPVEFGGSLGRTEATGRGGVYVLKSIMKSRGIFESPNKKLTVAVQGFGNVGYFVAKILSEEGFKVVAVSDSKGGITTLKEQKNSKLENTEVESIDIEQTLKCKKEKGKVAGCYCLGSVCDFKYKNRFREISSQELLELPVDILVPAALENVINEANAGKIKAKIILEMANGPTSPAADKILYKNGVMVIPDVLANSGGVTVSYFEWVQNLKNQKWSEEEVNNELKMKMEEAVREIIEITKKQKADLRTGAFLLALKRILEKN